MLIVTASLSVWAARRRPGRWLLIWMRALALLVLAGWIGEYVADLVLGTWAVKYDLPLQLTDAVSLVTILALWTRRQLLVELTYFWSLTASLQAILTPDLAQTFPSVYYFTYFVYHVGAVVAACLLVFGCRLYPRPGAFWRVFVITLAYAATRGLATRPRRGSRHGSTRRPHANWSPSQLPFSGSTYTPWPEELITQLSPR